MSVVLRPARPEDAAPCGKICFEAFNTISKAHNFPPDFPSPEAATGLMNYLIGHPKVGSAVAEEGGRVVGSNFIDLRCPVAGVGPITVDPKVQNSTIGRSLMERVHAIAKDKGVDRVRLVQAAFHNRSLSLYTKLGYDVREPLSCVYGTPPGPSAAPGRSVRQAVEADLAACNQLCTRIHGHDRGGDLAEAIGQKTAAVVERGGRLTGYATVVGFFGHAVGEENMDVAALIANAKAIAGSGFLLPTRNGELFRWCLSNGFRVVQPMSLMSRGPYQDPKGAFLASILF